MPTLTPEIFKFLRNIKTNNNREWFLKNKEHYENARKELTAFAEAWFGKVISFDKSLKPLDDKAYVFRIYRDARFAKGNLYKTNMATMIIKGGRPAMHSRAGYYLHIEPGGCFLAGGCYLPPSEWLNNIRTDISKSPQKIKEIIKNASFKKYFNLEGEKVKTTPKGFPKDHPEIELLRHKSYMAIHHLTDQQVTGKNFLDHLSKACKALQPFDEYFNKQLP